MLPEPERSLVEDWLAQHAPQRVPFGVSGSTFYAEQRMRGMMGHLKRHGAQAIERAALDMIALGLLSVVQARVGVVWHILREHGPLCASEIEKRLGLSPNGAMGRAIMDELLRIGAGEVVADARFRSVRAIGRAPHWRDYLAPPQERAA